MEVLFNQNELVGKTVVTMTESQEPVPVYRIMRIEGIDPTRGYIGKDLVNGDSIQFDPSDLIECPTLVLDARSHSIVENMAKSYYNNTVE